MTTETMETAALKSAIDASLAYAENRGQKMLDAMDAKINEAFKAVESQVQVLEVKLGDLPKVKLTKPAHPQLKEVLILAKIANATNTKHPYLVGPSGSGKTTLGAQIAEALGQRFGHISLTSGASETWLWGRQTPSGFNVGQFADFYENGGCFLFDEIDAADANLLIALNTALANGSAYNPIEGRLIKRHKDFYCIAAGNTFGLGADFAYTGRNRLDAATLDRFVGVVVDYLPNVEKQICPDDDLRELFLTARKTLRKSQNPNAETITYRALAWAQHAFTAGIDIERILELLFAAWPDGLIKQTFFEVKL